MSGPDGQNGMRSGLMLADEAVLLVRRAPLSALAAYYLGALPFTLALLYFWADMARSGQAAQRLAAGAALVALAFVWMKAWQCVYCRALYAQLGGGAQSAWTAAQWGRMAVRQGVVHACGLLMLPPVTLALAPAGYVYAALQNATVLDDGGDEGAWALWGRAFSSACLWPKQNHAAIWLLSPYPLVVGAALYVVISPVMTALTPEFSGIVTGVFVGAYTVVILPLSPLGVVTALNLAAGAVLVPHLLKSLLGVETLFSLHPMGLLNSTFFAIVIALTYLVLDPAMKAAYVLRCFRGRALRDGSDLRVTLKRFMALLLVAGACGAAQAQQTGPVSPEALDAAIERELAGRAYAWRMPREQQAPLEESIVGAFLRGGVEAIEAGLRAIADWFRGVLDWLDENLGFNAGRGGQQHAGVALSPLVKVLLYVLIALLAATLVVMLWRYWRQQRAPEFEADAAPETHAPNIEDEATTADMLDEASWAALARELAERGELRLALRALFLAILANLGRRGLIHIARHKSNHDYARELERRAHAAPGAREAFARCAAVYEAAWYGAHEVTREQLAHMAGHEQRLRGAHDAS